MSDIDAVPANDQKLDPESLATTMKLLWRHVSPIRMILIIGVLATVAASFIRLAQPLATGFVLESLGDSERLATAVWVLVATLLFAIATQAAGSYLTLRAAEDLVRNTRIRLVDRLIGFSVPEMQRQNPGDLSSRVTADSSMVRMVAMQLFTQVLIGVITVVGSLIAMAALHPFLLSVTLASIIVPGGLLLLVMPKVRQSSRRTQNAMGALSKELERVLGMFTAMKANTAERIENERLDERIDEARNAGNAGAAWRAVSSTISLLTMQIAYLVVLAVGGVMVQNGSLTVPELITFLMYALQLSTPVIMLTAAAGIFQTGRAALERIAEAENMEQERQGPRPGAAGAAALVGPDGSDTPDAAVFSDVEFGYQGTSELALRGLDVAIPSHARTAFVGPSGCGKSTVLRLLSGFFEPGSGTLSIDGRPIDDWDLRELRRHVAYVEQESPVLEGSIRDNLLYGHPDPESVSDADLRDVLAVVALEHSFPDLDAGVGYRGASLSGGERQRLSIARGLTRRPSILLLDESTSALDTNTERQVSESLARVTEHTTVVMVAHRLSTIVDCEQIVVMEAGRLRSQGTHDELLVNDDLYRSLVQSRDEKDAEDAADAAETERETGEDDGTRHDLAPA